MIKKLSASSVSSFYGCQMKWFLEYILGYRTESGRAAAIGTMAHYVMEGVAKSKKLRQDNKKWRKDPIFGRIKQSYDLDEWADAIFDHNTKVENHIEWSIKDRKLLKKYINTAKNHRLFPENHKEIIETEQRFSLPINKPWAKYLNEQGKLEPIKINGFIDLIYRDSKDNLHYVDYKFGGKRGDIPTDFHTGKDKTFSTMKQDIQLCLYYWAIRQLFPNMQPITNIWYVNYNVVLTDAFEDEIYKFTMDYVKKTLDQIKDMDSPTFLYNGGPLWKCNYLCSFSKQTFSDFDRPELTMNASGSEKFDSIGGKKCVCDTMKTFFNNRSLNSIVENCKNVK